MPVRGIDSVPCRDMEHHSAAETHLDAVTAAGGLCIAVAGKTTCPAGRQHQQSAEETHLDADSAAW